MSYFWPGVLQYKNATMLMPSSLLLNGALKWGTQQTSTSTYTGIMKGQSCALSKFQSFNFDLS